MLGVLCSRLGLLVLIVRGRAALREESVRVLEQGLKGLEIGAFGRVVQTHVAVCVGKGGVVLGHEEVWAGGGNSVPLEVEFLAEARGRLRLLVWLGLQHALARLAQQRL